MCASTFLSSKPKSTQFTNHDFQIICHPSDTLVHALQFVNHPSNPASVTEGHVVGRGGYYTSFSVTDSYHQCDYAFQIFEPV